MSDVDLNPVLLAGAFAILIEFYRFILFVLTFDLT